MSTDFSAVCDRCRAYVHAGQRMAMSFSFGYGPNDRRGAELVARFVCDHLDCLPGGLRIVHGQEVPTNYINAEGAALPETIVRGDTNETPPPEPDPRCCPGCGYLPAPTDRIDECANCGRTLAFQEFNPAMFRGRG